MGKMYKTKMCRKVLYVSTEAQNQRQTKMFHLLHAFFLNNTTHTPEYTNVKHMSVRNVLHTRSRRQ